MELDQALSVVADEMLNRCNFMPFAAIENTAATPISDTRTV